MRQSIDLDSKEQADQSTQIYQVNIAENIERQQSSFAAGLQRYGANRSVCLYVAIAIILSLQIYIFVAVRQEDVVKVFKALTGQMAQTDQQAAQIAGIELAKQAPIRHVPRPLIYKSVPIWKPDPKKSKLSANVSLWDLSRQEKIAILNKGKELARPKSPKDKLMDINYSKDQETAAFFKKYEADSDEFDWANLTLSDEQSQVISEDYSRFLEERRTEMRKWINKYAQKFGNKRGHLDIQRGIYYSEFVEALSFMALTGQDINNSPFLSILEAREKKHFEKKYKLSAYKTEIPLCIITPTYNNVGKRHYIWNTESILQQQYSNFKWIIVDDASTDGTLIKTAEYLKWRNASSDRVTLVDSRKHRTALENIYYAAHKYCDYGQIMFIIDGDDQIIGTQVFKLYNAIYQQQKPYVLYSNYFNFKQNEDVDPLWIGISRDYPIMVKQYNNYRYFYHSYSQLRTSLSDIFFMIKLSSLKDAKGQMYWTLYDNAIFFPSMQLACGKIRYLSELLYWYYTNSGTNDSQTSRREEYNIIFRHIAYTQKPYSCIDDRIAQIRKKMVKSNKIIAASNKKL